MVVSAVGHVVGAAASGGHIIDAATSRGEDSWGLSYLVLTDEAGDRQPRYTSLEIVPAQWEGAPASIRVTGGDSRSEDIRVETAYLLAPGDPFVTIRTTYFWAPRDDKQEIAAFDRIAEGRSAVFLAGQGFLARPHGSGDSLHAGESLLLVGDGVVYGWRCSGSRGVSCPEKGTVRMGIAPSRTADRRLVFERRLYAGDGDPALLTGWMTEGPTGSLSGKVASSASGRPVAGAAVEIRDVSGIRTVAFSGLDGVFRAALPPGSYTAACVPPGGVEASRMDFVADPGKAETLNFEVNETATVRFQIEDELGGALPGRLTIRDRSGRSLTREPGRAPLRDVLFAPDGHGAISVAPGEYTLVASHGLDYSIDEQSAALEPGSVEEVTFRLRREVDLGDLAAADFRVHTLAGLEGPATAAEQAGAALGEGLAAIVFADDGRVFKDFSLGEAVGLFVIPGEEIVLGEVGRFGVFPLSPEEEVAPRGGAGVEGKAPASLFSELRGRPSRPLIQVHAPRMPGSGYFETMHVDPVTALSSNIEFDGSFDLLEVASAEEIDEASAVLNDWFHLLNLGHRVFAVGNSGSADRERSPLGVPRNYVDLNGLTKDGSGIVDAVRAGRSFLTTGPFLRFRIDGDRRPGDLVADTDGLVAIELDVDAAPWIGVENVRVFGNGSVLIERRADRRSGSRVLALRETLALRGDTWLVAVAASSRPLDPVYQAPDGGPIFPVAVSNPIWVDFDGDGGFDAPGVR